MRRTTDQHRPARVAAAALLTLAAAFPAAALTEAEIDRLRRAVSLCWSAGPVPAGAQRVSVTVGVTMNRDGTPAAVRMIRAEGADEAAFQAARRAVLRCAANAQLPADKYDRWREIEIEFDYNGMRLK